MDSSFIEIGGVHLNRRIDEHLTNIHGMVKVRREMLEKRFKRQRSKQKANLQSENQKKLDKHTSLTKEIYRVGT